MVDRRGVDRPGGFGARQANGVGSERKVVPAGLLPDRRRLLDIHQIGEESCSGVPKRNEEYAEDDFRRTDPRFQGGPSTTASAAAQLAPTWLLRHGKDLVPIPGTCKAHRLGESVWIRPGADDADPDAISAQYHELYVHRDCPKLRISDFFEQPTAAEDRGRKA